MSSIIDHRLQQSILYQFSQNSDSRVRETCTNDAIVAMNSVLKKFNLENIDENAKVIAKHVDDLKRDGITILGPVFTASQIKDINDNLKKKKVYDGHVWNNSDKKPRLLEEIKAEKKLQASYILDDIITTPHILELANDSKVLAITQNYLNCIPTLYQMNIMWNLKNPSTKEKGVSQDFHRDWDSLKSCVLFVYLTDNNKGSGAHQYIKKTHLYDRQQELRDAIKKDLGILSKFKNVLNVDIFHKKNEEYFRKHGEDICKNYIETISAPAGFAFMVDTFGLHRGIPPMIQDRLLIWFRYSFYDNGFNLDIGPVNYKKNKDEFSSRLPVIQENKTYEYINRAFINYDFQGNLPITYRT